ncbi:hypothetical protein K435DRAFT_847692 [Dendrothele bispora CBS 962.96]|uniref:Uncharacterized protein n=1 Tax=Dendrothele bispora (strain CBS 962.96) TaxID=1314807 RepID=A0A4S8MWZ0_DENBC|nr:hypothetical protein K435DRAFT_847692 [Dendrothele bispora CBS 962.96]
MADLPPRPELPLPPRITRRDDRPYPLRDSYEPRYERRDDFRRDYDRGYDRDWDTRERERDRDRDREYDRRAGPPPRRGPPGYDRDRDRYDRDRRPPPRYRSRSRDRDRYYEARYERFPPRSPPRSPPRRESYYRPRSRSRTPPRRPPPPLPSPPRIQSRRRSPTPRRSPPPPSTRSRSPPSKRIRLGTHSIGSPPSARSPPPLRHASPSRRSPYHASSRPRSPPRRDYPSPRRSDRGSEKSFRRDDYSPPPTMSVYLDDNKGSRGQSPVHRDTFEPPLIKPEPPIPSRDSYPPPPPPVPPDDRDDQPLLDNQGDTVMKTEPSPTSNPGPSTVALPPRPHERSPSPPRHPRRRDDPPRDRERDPWHDTPGPHPPTQPRGHGFPPRGVPIRGRGAFRGSGPSGFTVEPPRAPRNRGILPTALPSSTAPTLAIQTQQQVQNSPFQSFTPTLPTPTPMAASATTSAATTPFDSKTAEAKNIFANIPEPVIPDYRALISDVFSSSTPNGDTIITKLGEMESLRKQIVLQQKHAFNLSLEYGNVYKMTRRALHEFEMANFDLRAAVKRRESTRTQLELAKMGVLGIDFEGREAYEQDQVEFVT